MVAKTLNYIRDYTAGKVTFPSETPEKDESLLKQLVSIIKSVGRDTKGKIVQISDASHGGYYGSHNLRIYDAKSIKGGDYKSWYTPFMKPIIWNHDESLAPMGRIYHAWYVPTPNGQVNGFQCDGIVKTGDYIPDRDAIDKIIDGLYLSMSSSLAAKKAICNICGRDIDDDECDHVPGKEYDGQKCLAIFSGLRYRHLSYVNSPAHETSRPVAGKVMTGENDDKKDYVVMTGSEAKDWLADHNLSDDAMSGIEKVRVFNLIDTGPGIETHIYYDISDDKSYHIFGNNSSSKDEKSKTNDSAVSGDSNNVGDNKGDNEMDPKMIALLENKEVKDFLELLAQQKDGGVTKTLLGLDTAVSDKSNKDLISKEVQDSITRLEKVIETQRRAIDKLGEALTSTKESHKITLLKVLMSSDKNADVSKFKELSFEQLADKAVSILPSLDAKKDTTVDPNDPKTLTTNVVDDKGNIVNNQKDNKKPEDNTQDEELNKLNEMMGMSY